MPSLSPGFDYFVRSCLCKNPEDRWQSAHDVLLELRWAGAGAVARPRLRPPTRAVRRTDVGLIAALALALVGLAAVALMMRAAPAAPAGHRARFDVALPEALGFDWPDWPVVSPSGEQLVFTARLQGKRQLWMRSLDGTVSRCPTRKGPPFLSGHR